MTSKLAFLEFKRAFGRRAAGGRDLFWLTLLMFFVQFLALLILAARGGILERSIDAFLGNTPDYGIPVWVLPNYLGTQQPVMITSDLLSEVSADGFHAAPFRRLENGRMLRLPADGIWRGEFAGMAVELDGPLAARAAVVQSGDGPWQIVLDRRLFAAHFNLEAYRSALKGRLPEADWAEIPSSLEALDRLWLSARVHQIDRLMAFDVTWSGHFGVGSDKVAFMVPIALHNLFTVAQDNPGVCAFLEAGPGLGLRVKAVRSAMLLTASDADRAVLKAEFKALSERVGGGLVDRGSRLEVALGNPELARKLEASGICDGGVAEAFVDGYAQGLSVEIADQMRPTRPFEASSHEVRVTCSALTPSALELAVKDASGDDCVATVDLANPSGGYNEMQLYARSRSDLKRLVDYMKCAPVAGTPAPSARKNLCVETAGGYESRLMINQIYEDSLSRFSFLTSLLSAISGPIGLVMVGLLAAILWVQLGVVIEHRRKRYMMFLASGLSWLQIRGMLVLQMALATGLGLVLAAVSTLSIRTMLSGSMAQLATRYEKITQGEAIDVLPFGIAELGIVGISTLVLGFLIAILQLRLNGVSPAKPLDVLGR